MSKKLIVAIEAELSSAKAEEDSGNINRVFYHLERAHILSQRLTINHVQVHWYMLKLSIKICDWHEISGQIRRIVAAALFSRIWVPIGNTGRSNVSAFLPMPIPDDLRTLLEQDNN